MPTTVVPIVFVRDVTRAAEHYRDLLGFQIDFLHGEPAFYGAVSYDGARLHLRYVPHPNFADLAADEDQLILASFEVENIQAIHDDLIARGAEIAHPLTQQPWGGTDLHVRDPDGNVFSFVQYGR